MVYPIFNSVGSREADNKYLRVDSNQSLNSTQKQQARDNLDARPIGTVYIQYPGKSDPATLWGGTWAKIFDTEGTFFRTEGGNASTFGGGLQGDIFQGHYHSSAGDIVKVGGAAIGALVGGSSVSQGGAAVQAPTTDGSNGTPRTGNETRPKNRTIRIWERTA